MLISSVPDGQIDRLGTGDAAATPFSTYPPTF